MTGQEIIEMTESDKKTETPAKTVKPATSPKPSKKSGRGAAVIATFATVFALVALGGAGYVAYRMEVQKLPQIESEINRIEEIAAAVQSIQQSDDRFAEQLSSATKELQSQIQSQSDRVNELETVLTQSDTEFGEKLDAIIESTSSLYQNLDQLPSDWELNDVSLLLLMGAKQLQLTGDPEVVLPVWQAAVEQVGRVSDPQLLVVRTQLNKEIELLETMDVVEIETISAQLMKLSNALDDLPIRTQLQELSVEPSESGADEDTEQEQAEAPSTLNAIWLDLKSLIRVKKISEDAPLPLNPNLKNELVQHLKLSLAAAQLAALREETSVYRANLEFVKGVVKEQFNVGDATVGIFIATLDDLLLMPLTAELPDISGSYDLLQEILDQQSAE